jgi:hypothetical protein
VVLEEKIGLTLAGLDWKERPDMSVAPGQVSKQIDDLLNLPQQSWLLGAGASRAASVPLMIPLTDRVHAMLQGENKADFQAIRESLTEHSHVEHVLSQIGDLIALASRTKAGTARVGAVERGLAALNALHAEIQKCIRDTIRWGYEPAHSGAQQRIGSKEHPIVTIDAHLNFVRALFSVRRANLERRPPVALFTTNYDTLLEDALALGRVPISDGFVGGAMAFWEPGGRAGALAQPFAGDSECQARVYKLHGSVDWYMSEEDLVVRRREGAGYPPDDPARLLIYPQATKYRATQKDPFASIFGAFRGALNSETAGLLAVVGYSFSDEHVNEEIAMALRRRDSQLTVLAFVRQPDDDKLPEGDALPAQLAKWLKDEPWKERLIVAGSRGVYHGSLDNLYPADKDHAHAWWSFAGVTAFLRNGPEIAP